ncbi:flavodoxin domain-containing protein [Jeotgalibacillus salarius]|nr:flavodoxin domain-containing protein [Jeotgalibacillus salarius]
MIVYASRTGNTEQLAWLIQKELGRNGLAADYTRIEDFDLNQLSFYQACIVVTYTWGTGDVPKEMVSLYEAFERKEVSEMVTAIAGTGDQCYAHFCGAVDRFRDMLYVHSNLAVTLKVELSPQRSDGEKCGMFVKKVVERLYSDPLLTTILSR